MAKETNNNKSKHQKTFATDGQRVCASGNWIYMQDGSRFKRTVLPSVATGDQLKDTPDEIDLDAGAKVEESEM